ncbi:hypothetical protein VP758_002164 [Vibrio harveyi]|nr:hypothetical protein [Vibrio harveyi]
MTEANGLPHAVIRGDANVHDIKLALQTLKALGPSLQVPLYLDRRHTGQCLHDELVALSYIPHVQSRSKEAVSLKQSSDYKVRRWIAEQTHS